MLGTSTNQHTYTACLLPYLPHFSVKIKTNSRLLIKNTPQRIACMRTNVFHRRSNWISPFCSPTLTDSLLKLDVIPTCSSYWISVRVMKKTIKSIWHFFRSLICFLSRTYFRFIGNRCSHDNWRLRTAFNCRFPTRKLDNWLLIHLFHKYLGRFKTFCLNLRVIM